MAAATKVADISAARGLRKLDARPIDVPHLLETFSVLISFQYFKVGMLMSSASGARPVCNTNNKKIDLRNFTSQIMKKGSCKDHYNKCGYQQKDRLRYEKIPRWLIIVLYSSPKTALHAIQ